MDTSVNAANQVVSVGADIAFDADPKFFACLVRFESSSVPTKTQSEPKDRKSGSVGMPRPMLYAVFRLNKKKIMAKGTGSDNDVIAHHMVHDTLRHSPQSFELD